MAGFARRPRMGENPPAATALPEPRARIDHDEDPADDLARDRRAQRAHRTNRDLARAGDGAGQLGQCADRLPVQPELQRLPRTAVGSVRRRVPAVRGVHAAAQRTHSHRRAVFAPLRARPALDRCRGHAAVPVAGVVLHRLAVVAGVRERLGQQRDVEQRRRPCPLARKAAGSDGLLAVEPAGRLRTDQAYRRADGPDPRPDRSAGGSPRRSGRRRRGIPMIAFVTANIAPLMFAALVVFLLLGYPVAFALGAVGLSFGLLGVYLDLLHPALFQALPERIFGIMANDTLLAVPFFTFMGLILERSGMAEDLLDTRGQLFGPVRGRLAYAVVLVGALLAATTGVVAASVISMGLISLPIMLRYGYDRRLASGVIAASGTLAQIIPPSLVLIVLADQLGRSVGDMYQCAFIPRFKLTALYAGYVLILTFLNPGWAPTLEPEGRPVPEATGSRANPSLNRFTVIAS